MTTTPIQLQNTSNRLAAELASLITHIAGAEWIADGDRTTAIAEYLGNLLDQALVWSVAGDHDVEIARQLIRHLTETTPALEETDR